MTVDPQAIPIFLRLHFPPFPVPSGRGAADWFPGDLGCPPCSQGAQPDPFPPSSPARSIESPNLGFSTETFLPHLLEDELGQLSDLEAELDSQNWQHTVGREVAAQLSQREIDRQEVINGEEGETKGPGLARAQAWREEPLILGTATVPMLAEEPQFRGPTQFGG